MNTSQPGLPVDKTEAEMLNERKTKYAFYFYLLKEL
jgi:hypothetical protein